MKRNLLICLLLFFIAPLTFATEFKIKPKTSKVIAIACCHAFVKKVEIVFKKFSAIADYDQKNKQILSLKATLDTNSLSSNNRKRDNHLRTEQFFAVKDFPTITFTSISIKPNTDGLLITGILTMKGISKEITLQAKIISAKNNNFEISASGEINSKDFGVGTSKQRDLVTLKINSVFEKN